MLNNSIVMYFYLSPREPYMSMHQEQVECVIVPGPIFTGAYPASYNALMVWPCNSNTILPKILRVKIRRLSDFSFKRIFVINFTSHK